MPRRILFRSDSSSRIGLGHIKRDLVLASRLDSNEIHFASMSLPGNINHEIPYPVHPLKTSDVKELIDLCKHLDIDHLIVDHYGLTLEDEKQIKKNSSLRLSVFDDTYEEHYCDEVINHNLGANPKKYARKVPSFCKISLMTPLIRQEFPQEKKHKRHKKGIFLSLGGSDPKNLILRILKLLKQHGREVSVAITSSNTNISVLKAYAYVNRWVKLHIDDDIPKLLNSCELAIVTPSVLAAETLFMGVPLISVRTADNQIEVEKYLKRQRFTTLKASQVHKLKNPSFLHVKPAYRPIAYTSLSDSFSLYKVSEGDLFDLFELANDPVVRQNSFSSQRISLEEHKKWFSNLLHDTNVTLYTVRSQTHTLIGQVRFNKIDKKAIISISISKDFRGKSLAADIIKRGCETFLSDNTNIAIEAQIKEGNIPSEKSFQKAGFICFEKKEGRVYYHYEQEHE